MEHSLKNSFNKFVSLSPYILIVFIGIAYFIMGFYMPALGDDLGFYYSFESQNDSWYALPRSMYRHWIWNNARMADMITPIGLYIMPLWLRALTYGIFTSAFFYIITKFSIKDTRQKYFYSIIIIALIAFTFRWDAIWMEYCATYNYIWSSVFSLLALMLILKHNPESDSWYWWLCIPFCFIASAMHEASGLPMAVGMIIWLCLSGFFNKQKVVGKLMILAFICGGIFTITSPASYSRVGSMLQPEPVMDMLLFSAGYVVLLIIAIAALFIYNRSLLKSLAQSEWLIFVIAAICSTCFMLLSQYGGRTGWFAEVFAMVALFQIISRLDLAISPKFKLPVGFILSICIIFHYSALVWWQIKVGIEAEKAIELYENSSNGIIFMDYLNEPQLPWYLLNKTHGVPDDDDTYYRYRISKHHGNGKNLVILPTATENLDWKNFSGLHYFGDKIISDKPLPNRYVDKIVDIFPRKMTKISNKEYIEQRFNIYNRTLYLYSPVDRDRGEK